MAIDGDGGNTSGVEDGDHRGRRRWWDVREQRMRAVESSLGCEWPHAGASQ